MELTITGIDLDVEYEEIGASYPATRDEPGCSAEIMIKSVYIDGVEVTGDFECKMMDLIRERILEEEA